MSQTGSAAARINVPFNAPRRSVEADRTELLAAVERVLDSGWYVLGTEVTAFEREFGATVDGADVVGVGNGTDALELALRALDVGPGSEVITVANAGGYTSTACHLVGATPRYVDVRREDLLIDPTLLAPLIGERTRAVVVTHLYGDTVDVDAVRAQLPDGMPVIEDCAQAHGATLPGGWPVGSRGDLATFSFYPTKNLGAIGDGGAVVTRSSALAEVVRRLRMYGWSPKYRVVTEGGRNSRLDEIQAAMLRVRLASLQAGNARRAEIVSAYRGANSAIEFVGGSTRSSHHLCVVRSVHRGRWRGQLDEFGVATDVHYPVADHVQVGWRTEGTPVLPVTEAAADEIFSLPCFPELSDAEVDAVCSALRTLA